MLFNYWYVQAEQSNNARVFDYVTLQQTSVTLRKGRRRHGHKTKWYHTMNTLWYLIRLRERFITYWSDTDWIIRDWKALAKELHGSIYKSWCSRIKLRDTTTNYPDIWKLYPFAPIPSSPPNALLGINTGNHWKNILLTMDLCEPYVNCKV